MTRRILVAVALAAAPLAAVGDPPQPADKSKAARLVEQLGSEEFAEREAAGKELDALGAAALAEIQAGCRSADPEVARRARELAARISYRGENEKLLAPTLVELDAADAPLDTLLADLSKQAKYEVVLNGPKRESVAAKKVSVKTGRVPFWDAVLKVCDAADLQIASVGGFTAPGSVPYSHRSAAPLPNERVKMLGADRPALGFVPPPLPPNPGPIGPAIEAAKQPVRTAALPNLTVALEPRDGAKKRPAAVFGAVCVEAFAIPPAAGVPDVATALLQVWPEPKLTWKENRAVKVDRSADDRDLSLAAIHEPVTYSPQVVTRGGVQGVRNVNGNVIWLNDGGVQRQFPRFTPNVRQAVVKFKSADRSPASLKEFAGSVFAVIRSGLEPVASAELVAGKTVTADANSVSLKARLVTSENAPTSQLEVELTYDPNAVQPVGPTDPLAGVRDSRAVSNHTVYGVRVTDAEGNPFSLALSGIAQRPGGVGGQMFYNLRMTARPLAGTKGEPKSVAFWGTFGKSVEVPFELRDVPLVVGKK